MYFGLLTAAEGPRVSQVCLAKKLARAFTLSLFTVLCNRPLQLVFFDCFYVLYSLAKSYASVHTWALCDEIL